MMEEVDNDFDSDIDVIEIFYQRVMKSLIDRDIFNRMKMDS
jgi:hypothetical protein